MSQLWSPSLPLLHFVIRGAVVYAAVLILLRLGGKRQIAQMGRGEFVALLLISNAVQNSMNGGDNSISGGLLLASVIVGLSILLSIATYRSRRLESLIEGRPTLLIHNGEILQDNLARERLNVHELMAMLRRQGIHSLGDIFQAILESDGLLNVIRKSDLVRSP